MIALAADGNGPLHQLLGSDSYAFASTKLDTLQSDF